MEQQPGANVPSNGAAALFSCDLPDGKSWLCMVAKRAYRLVPGGRAVPLAHPPALVLAPETREAGDDDQVVLAETDLCCAMKPLTDVLLTATARSLRGPVQYLDTGLELGVVRKLVRVFGERQLVVANGELRFSEPHRFRSLALKWEDAYGGRDLETERLDFAAEKARNPDAIEGSLAYPRNRVGTGYWRDRQRQRLHGLPVPRLEDPADPVRPDRMLARDDVDWIDRPAAAGYSPIDVGTFPRVLFMLPLDFHRPARPVHEVRMGSIREADLAAVRGPMTPPDFRVYNAAPAGQAVARLGGAERLKLWNLHPDLELLECDLPADRPRMWVEPPGAGRRELEPQLGSVVVEPEIDQVTLTWGARLQVGATYEQEACDQMNAGALFHVGAA